MDENSNVLITNASMKLSSPFHEVYEVSTNAWPYSVYVIQLCVEFCGSSVHFRQPLTVWWGVSSWSVQSRDISPSFLWSSAIRKPSRGVSECVWAVIGSSAVMSNMFWVLAGNAVFLQDGTHPTALRLALKRWPTLLPYLYLSLFIIGSRKSHWATSGSATACPNDFPDSRY